MELKFAIVVGQMKQNNLLIVPNGIEITEVYVQKDRRGRLLIVPNGIEIAYRQARKHPCKLLIVPNGIEICCGEKITIVGKILLIVPNGIEIGNSKSGQF